MSNTNLQPFHFDGASIRVVSIDNEPWFVGKDVALALGYKDTINAIKQHCRGVVKHHPIRDSLGRAQEVRVISEGDVMRLIVSSQLPAAERFERWVFDEVLPTIRKTGSYTAHAATNPQTLPSAAAKEFRALFGVARLIGCDRNAATISANNAVTRLTGTNLLHLLGQTHLEAENQSTLWFTPTELGKRLGISARQFNLLLAEAGLQARQGDKWEPTDAATGLFRLLDTGKSHGDGTPVTQLKWSNAVLGKLSQETVEEAL